MMDAAALSIAVSGELPRGVAGAVIAAGLVGLALWGLARLRPIIRQTTLIGPWWWSLAAVSALGLVEVDFQLRGAQPGTAWLSAARFMASALTLCPIVAVLGAKRPQDKAWHFVVLALWAIIALPSILTLLLGRGTEFRLAALRGLILWILMLLPAINYLPTGNAASALLVVIGQFVLFAPHLPGVSQSLVLTDPGLVSLGSFAAAALVAQSQGVRRAGLPQSFDRAWLEFRDLFGLFWSLRVQERVNAAARQFAWPCDLSWNGFRQTADDQPIAELACEQQRIVRQTFKGLLRRFVSAEWIAARLPRGID